MKLRMPPQAFANKVGDLGGNFDGQLAEVSNDFCSRERAIGFQQRQLPSINASVDPIVSESLSGFPANGMFVVILAICELESDRDIVFTKPYKQVRLVREEPAAPLLARDLLHVSNLAEHPEKASNVHSHRRAPLQPWQAPASRARPGGACR